MKYIDQITEAFTSLKFEPRDNQVQIINNILESFYDEGYKNVVVDAPTGLGKSVIAAVIAYVLEKMKPSNQQFTSWILSHRKILQDQYSDTVCKHGDFLNIKGADNYKCSVLSDMSGEFVTADSCIYEKIKDTTEGDACKFCPYRANKVRFRTAQHVVTNYSLFFLNLLYIKKLNDKYTQHRREITIFDESHVLNEAFSSHNAIVVSSTRIKHIEKDLEKYSPFYQTIKPETDRLLNQVKNFKEDNYKSILTDLLDLYKKIKDWSEAKINKTSFDLFNSLIEMKKISKKYSGYHCKIDDFFNFNYEHVVDKIEDGFSIQPIFMERLKDDIFLSTKNLFLSATNHPILYAKPIGLQPSETKFIKVAPVFPSESKKIYLMNSCKMNYDTLKNESDINKIIHAVDFICSFQREKTSAKGIILAPSFQWTEILSKHLRSRFSTNIIEHIQGQSAEEAVETFKRKRGFSILISPSIFEGIDLPGDLSRWQIFLKAPYASLSSNRVKYIANKYSNLYTLDTISKIVQGCGRSIRSIDDHAITFFIDSSLSGLFYNDLNIWKDHFQVIKTN